MSAWRTTATARFLCTMGVVASAVMTACGGSSPPTSQGSDERTVPVVDQTSMVPDAAELGACPPSLQDVAEEGRLDFVPLRGRLTVPGMRWWRVSGIERAKQTSETTTPQDRSIEVQLLGTTAVAAGAETPAKARVHGPSWPQISAAQANGYKLYVGRKESSGELTSIVAVDEGGRIGFVGECEFVMSTTTMVAFAKAARAGDVQASVLPNATMEDVLLAVLAPQSEAAKAFSTWGAPQAPPAWTELPADRRAIDPERTPEEVLAQLRKLPVVIDVPASLRGDDVTLCTKTSLAWGECTALDVGTPAEPLSVVAYLRPGDGFELWALDEAASFDQPLAKLFVATADVADAHLTEGSPLRLRPAETFASMQELISAANAGRLTFVT